MRNFSRPRGGNFNRPSNFGGRPQFDRPNSGPRPFGRPQGGNRINPKTEAKTISMIESYIAKSSSTSVSTEAPVVESTATFTSFNLPANLQSGLDRIGYLNTTPIQNRVIPLALEGKDVIGLAQTGTGKTAAFLVPLITRMLNNQAHRVLIMAPTRELAVQIQDDFRKIARDTLLFSTLCIGGTSLRKQSEMLRRPYQFLIGTPGRLLDMIRQKTIDLKTFDVVVLDEVDRMLDMGFVRDVQTILGGITPRRQSLFFSATLPREVESLCTSFANNPIRITVAQTHQSYPIKQHLVKLQQGDKKLEKLYDLLCQKEEFKKVIIFGRTKHGVRRLAEELDRRGFSVDSIHGNKSQAARMRSLDLFKSEQVTVLVATDVAARGIDISDVSHVINYDLPETVEDYVHRIGRTGRAGKAGIAITFIG